MPKHTESSGAGKPTTGNGRTGGRKPKRLECQQQTSTGATLWSATAKLFGSKKGKK